MRVSRWLLGLILLLAVIVPAQAQQAPPTSTATLTSATCPGTGCAVFGASGYGGIGVQLTGTFVATVQFEGIVANDTSGTFTAVTCTPWNSTTGVTSSTSTGLWGCPVGGLSLFRVRVSAYTSGSVVVTTLKAPTLARGSGGGGTISGTIAAGQYAVGTATDTIGASDRIVTVDYPTDPNVIIRGQNINQDFTQSTYAFDDDGLATIAQRWKFTYNDESEIHYGADYASGGLDHRAASVSADTASSARGGNLFLLGGFRSNAGNTLGGDGGFIGLYGANAEDTAGGYTYITGGIGYDFDNEIIGFPAEISYYGGHQDGTPGTLAFGGRNIWTVDKTETMFMAEGAADTGRMTKLSFGVLDSGAYWTSTVRLFQFQSWSGTDNTFTDRSLSLVDILNDVTMVEFFPDDRAEFSISVNAPGFVTTGGFYGAGVNITIPSQAGYASTLTNTTATPYLWGWLPLDGGGLRLDEVNFDVHVMQVTPTGGVMFPAMACPSGQSGPLTIDDTGTVTATCS